MSRLEGRDLAVRLGDRPVLERVDLSVPEGRLVGLIGPNGAGKTTLLRVLAGLIPAERGSVWVDGKPVGSLSRRSLACAVSYLPQSGAAHWPLAVRRIVLLGRMPHRSPWAAFSSADLGTVERSMARMNVLDLAERPVFSLSGGEKARVLLARALAVEAPVLLVDEPVAALDPYHQLQVMEILRDEARSGAGVVAVLHDLTLASRFCDDLVLLHEGCVLSQGSAATVLTSEALGRAYRITALAGCREGERFVLPWRRLDREGPLPGADRTAIDVKEV